MYAHRSGIILPALFPNFTWKKNTQAKEIYLTFDDGPVPIVTEFVLEQLAIYNAKATFFCVGDNIVKHPNIFDKILAEGHSIGNHTFNHLNGWNVDDAEYLRNVELCQKTIRQYAQQDTTLFRPPYGKLSAAQRRSLLPNYEVVMWTVLSGDFDTALHEVTCLEKSIYCTEKGAIIVFHDSYKAERNLRYALPLYLKFFAEKGYTFKQLAMGQAEKY